MIDNILFWLSKEVAEFLTALFVIASVIIFVVGFFVACRIYVGVQDRLARRKNNRGKGE